MLLIEPLRIAVARGPHTSRLSPAHDCCRRRQTKTANRDDCGKTLVKDASVRDALDPHTSVKDAPEAFARVCSTSTTKLILLARPRLRQNFSQGPLVSTSPLGAKKKNARGESARRRTRNSTLKFFDLMFG